MGLTRYTDKRGIVRWRGTGDPDPAPVRAPVHVPARKFKRVDSGPSLAVLDAWWASGAPWADLAELTGITAGSLLQIRRKRCPSIRDDLAGVLTGVDPALIPPPKPNGRSLAGSRKGGAVAAARSAAKRAQIVAGLRAGLSLDDAAVAAGTNRKNALGSATGRLLIAPDDEDARLIRSHANPIGRHL